MTEYTGPLFEELRALHSQRPFLPFAVKLKTGQRHAIHDPASFAMSPQLVVIMQPRVDLRWGEIEGFEVLASNGKHAEIVGLLRRKPFVPFAVLRNNGERYEVADRGLAGLSKWTIGIASPDEGMRIFQMDEVVGVEIHEPAS
jgi:hypothetical protein